VGLQYIYLFIFLNRHVIRGSEKLLKRIYAIIPLILILGIGIGLSVNISADQGTIPAWIKNSAKWWADGQITDSDFIKSLQWLIDNKILVIPQSKDIQTSQQDSANNSDSSQAAIQKTKTVKVTGWRSSDYGDDNQYGHDQSDPTFWIVVAQKMSEKFPGSTPGGILVVGEIDGEPETATNSFLPFPKPSGTYPNVTFGSTDTLEPLLTAYDEAGLKVYLQVESADADVPMLMDLIMNKYKHHPSVIGFGVDVEWYHQKQYSDGRPLTDDEVTAWAKKVATYNPNYTLLVKHWDASYLSNARPSNVLFLTDSEQIGSLSSAINEYTAWVDHFGTSQVGFQIGYPSDMSWWSKLSDPASSMINPVIAARPNANIGAVFWVDFSVLKEFPDN